MRLPFHRMIIVACFIGFLICMAPIFGCGVSFAQELPSTPLIINVAHVAPVPMNHAPEKTSRTPWGWTLLAVAAPLADGASTWWGMSQSGPAVAVVEGNGFYHKLFGANVTGGKIMAFKIGQATVNGLATHFAPKDRRANAIFGAVFSGALHGYVSVGNVRNGRFARRANREWALRVSVTP